MIAFVILHYQAMEETIQCVDSIAAHVSGDRRIIIVDNASPNRTGLLLRERYAANPEVSVLLNQTNDGFARGNNRGYREAKKLDPDFIVVLNSDTLLQQSDFTELIRRAYADHRFDVLGPDILSTRTGQHQNPQRDRNYTLAELERMRTRLRIKNRMKWAIWLKYRLFRPSEGASRECSDHSTAQLGKVLHGACYIFSRKFIEGHDDCFYSGTFMYFESYILHYLGMREGQTFLYDPDIRILHKEDASTDSTYTTMYKKSVFVNRCLLDSCEEFIKLQRAGKARETTES